MSARGVINPRWLSWTGLVYYGEVVGFACAWILGLTALAYSVGPNEPTQPSPRQLAAAGALDVDVIK